MTHAYISGIGMTVFGKSQQLGLRDYAEESCRQAFQDAEIGVSEVNRVYFSNAIGGLITGQEMIRGQVALRGIGLDGVPIINIENACASGSSALSLAMRDVASGAADNVLVVGSERMSHPDKALTFDAIARAIDLDKIEDLKEEYGLNSSVSNSLFMEIYAHEARAYMGSYGATADDFALVAQKSRAHGALNPRAQYRSTVTAQEVLESRSIADPLTLLMCSPIGDGSAAVIVSSRPQGSGRGIRLLASEIATAMADGPAVVTRAAQQAYNNAGLGPHDVDVVEVHDAAASAELLLMEQLGLCDPGEAIALTRSGATRLGGSQPINTSGGLISRGHPIGATGVAQIVELVEQLRGQAMERQVEGARVGLSQNSGGHMWGGPAVSAVTIVAAVDS